MLHEFETWGIKKGWEIIHNTWERFCNKIKRISRSKAKGAAEQETGKDTVEARCSAVQQHTAAGLC